MWSLHLFKKKKGCYSEAEEGKYFSVYLVWPFYIHKNVKEIWLQPYTTAQLSILSVTSKSKYEIYKNKVLEGQIRRRYLWNKKGF